MSRFSIMSLCGLLCFCFVADKSHACNQTPIACISNCPKFMPLKAFEQGSYLPFSAGAYSYDPDNGQPYCCGSGIVDYEWSWPYPYAYDVSYSDDKSSAQCKFNANGKFKVRVRVKDDEGVWSAPADDLEQWFTCTVYVFTMDLDISGVSDDDEEDPGGYVCLNDDDDNSNSTSDKDETGTVSGEDDLVQINLSYQPSTLDVGYAELKSPSGGQQSIRVWKNSTKGTGNMIIGASDEKEVWSIGSMPSTLWVEGYLTVLTPSQLWLSFTPDQQSYPGGGDYNTDPVNFTVVSVEISKCSSSWLPKKHGDSGYKTDITATTYPSMSGVSKTYKFTLDSSSRPGYCTNKGTETDKDLQFEPQTGYTISGSNNEIATIMSSSDSETVSVSSFDYGAYGKITCEVQIAGKSFLAHVPSVPLERFARIPLDDDENNIADAWPDNSGRAGDDNDDTPGGANTGDGLTRYEEYRGFVIGGTHTRTDANEKNLFIYDEDGIGFGNAGALGFTLHSINSNEWTGTSTRKINPNEDNDQCAIWLQNAGSNGQGILGECYLGTPNGQDHACVYVQEILNLGGSQDNIDKTIAHEIGHDVNISGDHSSPPECIMNQGLLVRTSYCSTCLSQRKLH